MSLLLLPCSPPTMPFSQAAQVMHRELEAQAKPLQAQLSKVVLHGLYALSRGAVCPQLGGCMSGPAKS